MSTQRSLNEMRQFILQLDTPVIFKKFLLKNENIGQSWKCVQWSLQDWSDKMQHVQMKLRIGDHQSKLSHPQWENTCKSAYMKFSELLKWSDGKIKLKSTCNSEISSDTQWAYYDYVYMIEQKTVNAIKEQVSWRCFGIDHTADESTLWIGTKGAHTPCHIDTYGCNLVAELFGKKMWILFPPSDNENLYPTRVPYEESSIYSQIDFTNINCQRFPQLCKTTPLVVVLEPGDVLFVPKHWWHFVESETFSISINTWIPLPSDDVDKLQEALIQFQVGSICQGIESSHVMKLVLNPNMLHLATMTPEMLLENAKIRISELHRNTLNANNSQSVIENTKLPIAEDFVKYSALKVLPLTFAEFQVLMSHRFNCWPKTLLTEEDGGDFTDFCNSVPQLLIDSLTDVRVVKTLIDVMLDKICNITK